MGEGAGGCGLWTLEETQEQALSHHHMQALWPAMLLSVHRYLFDLKKHCEGLGEGRTVLWLL